MHETLEKLYRDLEDDRIDTLEELLDFYNRNWDEKWHEGIFNSSDKDDWTHHDDGIMCITDYYNRYHPFDQYATAGIETDEKLNSTRRRMLSIADSWHVVDNSGTVESTREQTLAILAKEGGR